MFAAFPFLVNSISNKRVATLITGAELMLFASFAENSYPTEKVEHELFSEIKHGGKKLQESKVALDGQNPFYCFRT